MLSQSHSLEYSDSNILWRGNFKLFEYVFFFLCFIAYYSKTIFNSSQGTTSPINVAEL